MIRLEIDAVSENVTIARVTAAAFVSQFDPTVEEITDIKTAVSEAVTNAIIHGYGVTASVSDLTQHPMSPPKRAAGGVVSMTLTSRGRQIIIEIADYGVGIENIAEAMEPLFTTKPEMERSGMGFTVMQSFMTEVRVESKPGEGTKVTMSKQLGDAR